MEASDREVSSVVEADEIEALFVQTAHIDTIGRPMTPVSVAGMHRRGRRRERL